MDEQSFTEQLKSEGYQPGVAVEWDPGTVNDTHAHAFSARLLILAGEITVTTAEGATTCRAGDTFRLAAGTPHEERVGPAGVRFLTGRK